MSLLKYLSQVDPHCRDSQLPDPNGPLARAVPSSAISVTNESVNVSLESNKKAAKRGVYEKLSAIGVAVWRGLAVGQMEP